MSKITLQNTNLDFNVTIVAIETDTDVGSSLPLDIAAISNLEIEDNLIDFGITGSITYTNWFQIIDKLGVTEGRDKKILYIVIDIQNLDNQDTEDEARNISFIGIMESSTSGGGNIADAQQTYKFEEAITSRLKKTALTNLQGFETEGNPIKLIRSILEKSNTPYDDSSFEENTTIAGSFTTASIRDFWDNQDSLYVVINNLYNASFTTRRVPLLKVENIEGERKLQLRNLLTYEHVQFIRDYTLGYNSKDNKYAEVYQEAFLIGPEESETLNTSPYNKVESYNHIKPNIGELRQSVWGAYNLGGWKNINASADINVFEI